jgi:hypothetical protein
MDSGSKRAYAPFGGAASQHRRPGRRDCEAISREGIPVREADVGKGGVGGKGVSPCLPLLFSRAELRNLGAIARN